MFSTRLEENSFYPIFDFLKKMHSNGEPVMLNERIEHPLDFTKALTAAEKLLEPLDPEVGTAASRPWHVLSFGLGVLQELLMCMCSSMAPTLCI